ncbi:MAG: hypothetical protein KME47_09880 [Nodosilinea sp. WJT8-NPBG4]|jgi:hypothetical protein|nr:hypothetical protein [Nodosilinea sp. WJT8-NPBG4]
MKSKFGIHNYNLNGLDSLEILRLAVYQQKLANDYIAKLESQLDELLDKD